MRPWWLRKVAGCALVYLASMFLLVSCASNHAARAAQAVALPRFLELDDEPSISTFHFPRGLYSLDSEDRAGYYYRAPRSVMKHSFAGFAKYEGGIFVPKADRRRIRGYIVWAGGTTKIGNLARARYVFRS